MGETAGAADEEESAGTHVGDSHTDETNAANGVNAKAVEVV